MKHYTVLLCVLFLLCPGLQPLTAQQFSLENYEKFLREHNSMTVEQLFEMYPAGTFGDSVGVPLHSVRFRDSIDNYYHLTTDEKALLDRHSFVVTERLTAPTFVKAYADIFHKDLPVFVSTDGILHALHMSYSSLLSTVEANVLTPEITRFLSDTHGNLLPFSDRYKQPEMHEALVDLDVYLSVSLSLLGTPTTPVFPESRQTVDEIIAMIDGEKPLSYPLFSSSERDYDFSQFTPRGHYTQSPELTRYFRAMMWLGRTELYLLPPSHTGLQQKPEDIQRQTIMSVLLLELIENSGSMPRLDAIDSTLAFFVGEQDNVTLHHVRALLSSLGIVQADELLDKKRLAEFQEALQQQPYAFQHIMSQILYNDPFSPSQIQPASALLLLGQRFIPDSYITGNVVYDRIVKDGYRVTRLLPSTLDILFALGNDATAQLLQPELKKFHYSPNLAALRYLFQSYDNSFWNNTYYNLWLNSIRTLNPPTHREQLPAFMRTGAWWQEKLTTQLAAWSQLRHDNILYAKQSYSGGATCSFPCSYVEPIPDFYRAVEQLALTAKERFKTLPFQNYWTQSYVSGYFDDVASIMDTLSGIAQKELDGTALSEAEQVFLKGMLRTSAGCTAEPEYDGWYTKLYLLKNGLEKNDKVVADVHTAPTDEAGNPIGWVLHGGTGPINIGFWVATMPDGQQTMFVGPVTSYYEHVTTNFKRLTDEEWQTAYATSPSMRPGFVNLYLADATGSIREQGPTLQLGILTSAPENKLSTASLAAEAFPNPFAAYTTVRFTIPAEAAHSQVQLTIYDAHGREIHRLLDRTVPAGTYLVRWDGTETNGKKVASGSYYYRLTVGMYETTGTLLFSR